MTKVSRSAAISALLRGEEVWTGVRPEDAFGVKLLWAGFSRRQAAKLLSALRMAASCCRDMRVLATGLHK